MDRYTIYCTKEQIRKALELGTPIQKYASYYTVAPHTHICPVKDLDELDKSSPTINDDIFIVPTAEQMIGWLEEQGIYFDTEWSWDKQLKVWVWNNPNRGHICTSYNNSRKEATLAAIDAALRYLEEKNKNK